MRSPSLRIDPSTPRPALAAIGLAFLLAFASGAESPAPGAPPSASVERNAPRVEGEVLPAGFARPDIPEWWRRARAFYCPAANSGAGASLMQFRAGGTLPDRIDRFEDLPRLLAEARELGTSTLYLVDYWEPDYEHKGGYVPRIAMGGADGLREGVRRVHALGGRVILYLEAFIISRDTELGLRVGEAWAMMDSSGRFYSYQDTRERFYLMYPGEGSEWIEYLAGLAGSFAQDLEIDGVHLDSYGLQWGWRDHNPRHPGGTDPESFNRGAVRLVKRVREELRRHRPEAVVILEGAEHQSLLDIADGAQIESLEVLSRKPWFAARRYPIFTSGFEIHEMKATLDAGYGLALSPWWRGAKIRGRHEKALDRKTDKRNRFEQIEALCIHDNWLAANAIEGALEPGYSRRIAASIVTQLGTLDWCGEFTNPDFARAAERVRERVQATQASWKLSPADRLRSWLEEAAGRPRVETRPETRSVLPPAGTSASER